jgi:transcriptional regulator with XRE-family HTH domain
MAAGERGPKSPDNVDVEVGHLIRVQRLTRGLSQTDLADQIGVTFQQVQKYEKGANRISMGRLTLVGRVLGVNVSYLLGADRHATPAAAASSPKEQAKFAEAVAMLGRVGALRLLRAFAAIPDKPPELRESIVNIVEAAARRTPQARGDQARRGRRGRA